jgi:hypothetical protein
MNATNIIIYLHSSFFLKFYLLVKIRALQQGDGGGGIGLGPTPLRCAGSTSGGRGDSRMCGWDQGQTHRRG